MKNNWRKHLAFIIAFILILATVLQACAPAQTDPDGSQTMADPTVESSSPSQPVAETEVSEEPDGEEAISGRFVLAGIAEDASAENPYQIWLDLPFSAEEGTDAWSLTQEILEENDYALVESEWGNHIQKLTPPADSGQVEAEAAVTNGPDSSWMWSYNDNVDQPAHEYLLQDGDVIRWYFTNNWADDYTGHPETHFTDEGNSVQVKADAERPSDWTAWWSAFASSMEHNNVKEIELSLSGFESEELFTFTQEDGDWFDSYSDPLQVEEWIYLVYSDILYKINQDGSIEDSAALQFPIDSSSRIAYADGLLLVPMKYGKVQALTADNLTTAWISAAATQILVEAEDSPGSKVPHFQQSLSSLTVADGLVYQALCTVGWSERSFGGSFRALDLNDGSVVWDYSSDESGFYWTGGAIHEDRIFVGNDNGEIIAFDRLTGEILEQSSLPAVDGQPAAIRSNIVLQDDFLFFVSKDDGSLNRIEITDGKLGNLERVQFSDSSTASPTIHDGKVYVAGNNSLAIIDAESMQIEKTYEIEGYIQSTPLVLEDGSGRVFVYFTINNETGGIYGVATDSDTVHTVFTPHESQQNYCMATVSVSPDGTLYYTNDSHTFFAVQLLGLN